ncbi:MAG: TonB-dependent receptor [Acidobacteriota bacterium]
MKCFGRTLPFFFLLIVFPASLFAQAGGKITGKVTYGDRGTALSNTTVRIVPLNRNVVTDSNGNYEFADIAPGRYTIIAHQEGFVDLAKNLAMLGEMTSHIDFQMSLIGPRAQVIVTATGSKESSFAAIQPTETVNANKILERNNGGFADSLIDEPGVNKRSATPGSSRPVIRGFDSDRVLITTDGLRVGSIASQSENHAEPIDVLSLERIEVVKGPGTILYGSNAIGGVVNAVSRHEDQLHAGTSGYFSVLGSSNSRQAGVSGGVEQTFGKFMVWGNGSGQRSSDYTAGGNYGKVDHTFTRYGAGSGGFGYFARHAFGNISYSYYQTRYGIPIDPGEVPAKERSINLRRHDFRFNGGFRELNSFVESIRLSFDFSNLNQKEFEHELGEPVNPNPAIVFDNKVYSYRGLFTQRKYESLTGTFGIDGYRRNYRTQGAEVLIPGRVKQDSFSGFALEEVNLKRVGLQFGARVENNRYRPTDTALIKRDITGFSGAFGVRVPLGEANVFVANLTHSHRAPALEELYNDGPHDDTLSFEIGDNNLKPEVSNGIDLSLRHQDGRTRAEVNFFYYDIKNFVFLEPTEVIDVDTDLPISFYVQGNSRFFGAEASLDVKANKYVDLFANFDYVNAELKSGTPLPRIPPLRTHLGLDAHYKYLTVRPELTLAAHQERVFTEETTTDGYAVLNLAGNIIIPKKHFAHIFSVYGYNLTNQLYFNHVSFIKEFSPEIGRGVRGSYTIRFF